MDKYSKSSLTSVRASLKCVKDIKSFLLERDAAHLLTPMHGIEKYCVKCQRVHGDKNPFVTFLIVMLKCMHINVLSS